MTNRPLHIGVIGARGIGAFQGGIERYCQDFYPALAPGLFRVTIFVRHPSTVCAGQRHIRIVRLPVPLWRSFETLLHSFLSVIVARFCGIKTLHVHGITACLALPLARLLGMRVIVRHVGADYERAKWSPIARFVLRLAELACAHCAESVVCLTPHIAATFAAATGRNDGIVIPNGVREPAPAAEEPIGNYVLAVGRFVPEKNFHQLVEAFLAADLPASARLMLVGEADYPGPYARQLGILCAANPDRLILLGKVFDDELWRLYRGARVYVLPSDHEGMSFSLLEAGVCGAAIVASDISANRAVCDGFGHLYPAGSTVALRSAIEHEWHRPRAPGERAKQIAICRRQFDWREIARVMTPLLAGCPAPVPRASPETIASA